ncbi:g7800 [Coccomyxa elongata]
MAQPKVGLLGGRAPPSARLLRRPRPDRGALPGPLSLLCLCLVAGFFFLLLTSSRMDSVMNRSNKGGRRMTVRMGMERHISDDSAVMPLPDALPADLASAAAILGHGPRFRGSAKMETGGGHLGGLSLPKQETSKDAASRDATEGEAAMEALDREGMDALVDEQIASDQNPNQVQDQPDVHKTDVSAAAALSGKLPNVLPAEAHQKDTESAAAGSGGKKRGAQKVTTPQEVLAQGLIEAKNKRLTAQQQLTRQSIGKPKSLVHDSADTRGSLLSSMGVSKEGRVSEKLSSRETDTSAGDSAADSASSTENGGGGGAVAGGPPTGAGESAADSASESSGGGTAASVAVAAGGAFVEDEEEEEDEWDFDRKAQALQAQLFDLKGLIPGALRELPERPPRPAGGSRGKKQRLAAENRARTSSGECQQLLAKAIEGDKEREVRQREEELSNLVNIWDPKEEKKARETQHYQTRADHGNGKPAAFPPGTEGMLGRQYTEDRERAQKMMELTWDLFNATWHAGMTSKEIAEMWLEVVSPEAAVIIRGWLEKEEAMALAQDSQSKEASRGEAGDAAFDGPNALSTNPESVTEQAKALEGMLQDMCGGDEKCMLEAWKLCKEQPSCVQHVYMEHMVDRNAAKGTQQQTDEQQATPKNARPGAAAADRPQGDAKAAGEEPGEREAAAALEKVCAGRSECIQQIRLMCGQRAACIMGVAGQVTEPKSGGSKATQLGAGGTDGGPAAAGLNLLPLHMEKSEKSNSQKTAVSGASASIHMEQANASSASDGQAADGTRLQTSAARAERWVQELMSRMCGGRQACVEEVWRLCKGRYDCIKTSAAAHEAQSAISGDKPSAVSAASAASATAA